jgi:hypothetical protein
MVMAPLRWKNQTTTIKSQALSIYPKARLPSHAARAVTPARELDPLEGQGRPRLGTQDNRT